MCWDLDDHQHLGLADILILLLLVLLLTGRPIHSIFTPTQKFSTSVPEMYKDNQTVSCSFCSTVWFKLMGIWGVYWLASPFPTMNLPQSSYGNRISNGRSQWLDMKIVKLDLTFWLLTTLCLAQPCGITVKVSYHPDSKPKMSVAIYSV